MTEYLVSSISSSVGTNEAIWDCRGNPFGSYERLKQKPGTASCGNRPSPC